MGPSNPKSMGEKDFASGNCMTCGALSRWPKGLKVFKCTLCVTINDLVDLKAAIDSQINASGGRPTGPSGEVGPQGPKGEFAPPSFGKGIDSERSIKGPISLEITKRLVRDSLRRYLSSALGVRRPLEDSRESGSLDQPRPRGNTMGAALGVPMLQNGGDCAVTTPTIEVSNSESMEAGDGAAHVIHSRPGHLSQRSLSSSYPESRPDVNVPSSLPIDHLGGGSDPDGKRLFKPLEDYIANCFSPPLHSVNSSFMQRIPRNPSRRAPQPSRRRPSEPRRDTVSYDNDVPELDAKLLLLGDFAENGTWWTGRKEDTVPVRSPSHRDEECSIVTGRSPNIEWTDVDAWYFTVINAGESWPQIFEELAALTPFDPPTDADLHRIEGDILEAQEHLRKTLLKATESLLKRPGRPLTKPEDLRFLLILFANPLLHASFQNFTGRLTPPSDGQAINSYASGPLRGSGPASGMHSPIIKRILGLLSNTPAECHNHLISWFSRVSESRFVQFKDFAGGFLSYRLNRQYEKKQETRVDVTAGLIPQLAAGRTPASLHAALGHPSRSRSKKPKQEPQKKLVYHDDWQTKAAARVMGLLFAANNSHHRRSGAGTLSQEEVLSSSVKDQVQARGQIVPTSDFYATSLDDSDLVADFEAWEHKKSKFSFCQFPFLLSIWAKIQILEHDAKRQMHVKARDAFFDSIMSRRNVEQYLTLNVRRDCLVEDSLKSVSEVIGGGGEDIKKGLRIAFQGEEGVDAGGLKKEWFLLLVREVFNPDHGKSACRSSSFGDTG